MANPFDLSGKVALVTGANTGIGQAVAPALAVADADVACVGRTPAEDTVTQARALGRKAEVISADLSTIEPVGRVVDETVAKLGSLDVEEGAPHAHCTAERGQDRRGGRCAWGRSAGARRAQALRAQGSRRPLRSPRDRAGAACARCRPSGGSACGNRERAARRHAG